MCSASVRCAVLDDWSELRECAGHLLLSPTRSREKRGLHPDIRACDGTSLRPASRRRGTAGWLARNAGRNGSRGKAIRASCVVRARGRARRRSAPDHAWQVSASCSSVEPSVGSQVSCKGELLANYWRLTGAPGSNYVTGALGINVTASNRVYWHSKPFTGRVPVTGPVNLPVILQCRRRMRS
jgi:hypothetical protein